MTRAATLSLAFVAALLAVIGSAAAGLWAGFVLADYDLLCGADYQPHVLQRDFRTAEGLVLPKGLVVEARRCKPNIQARLQLFIDNEDAKDIVPAADEDGLPLGVFPSSGSGQPR